VAPSTSLLRPISPPTYRHPHPYKQLINTPPRHPASFASNTSPQAPTSPTTASPRLAHMHLTCINQLGCTTPHGSSTSPTHVHEPALMVPHGAAHADLRTSPGSASTCARPRAAHPHQPTRVHDPACASATHPRQPAHVHDPAPLTCTELTHLNQ
jgi:hypothetical protein